MFPQAIRSKCVPCLLLLVLVAGLVIADDDPSGFSVHDMDSPAEEEPEDDSFDFAGADEGGIQITMDTQLPVLLIADTSANIRLPVIMDALTKKNISFQLVYGNGSGVEVELISATGRCKYSSIVFTNSHTISRQVRKVFDDYQRNCRAKKVIMYTTPTTGTGVVMSIYGPTNHTANITFSTAAHPFLADAANTSIEISGVYSYPSKVVDSSRATPAITIRYSNSRDAFTAGAFISLSGGQRSLEIYLDSAPWTPHAAVLGNLIANWISTQQ